MFPGSHATVPAQDCEFAEWGSWYDGGGCVGLRFRQREVKIAANECGKPCNGSKVESKPHLKSDCVAQLTDCAFDAWSAWSACTTPMDQAIRTRSIRHAPSVGGQGCVGNLKETFQRGLWGPSREARGVKRSTRGVAWRIEVQSDGRTEFRSDGAGGPSGGRATGRPGRSGGQSGGRLVGRAAGRACGRSVGRAGGDSGEHWRRGPACDPQDPQKSAPVAPMSVRLRGRSALFGAKFPASLAPHFGMLTGDPAAHPWRVPHRRRGIKGAKHRGTP